MASLTFLYSVSISSESVQFREKPGVHKYYLYLCFSCPHSGLAYTFRISSGIGRQQGSTVHQSGDSEAHGEHCVIKTSL